MGITVAITLELKARLHTALRVRTKTATLAFLWARAWIHATRAPAAAWFLLHFWATGTVTLVVDITQMLAIGTGETVVNQHARTR